MSLSIDQVIGESKPTSKSAALLNKYLTSAVRLTHSDTIIGANRYLSDYATRPQWEEIKKEDVDAKRKEVKEALKGYGFKDKAAYYANIKAGEHNRETLIKMGAAVAAVAVAAAVSPELGKAVGMAAVAYGASKSLAAGIGRPETPKELFSTRDYADLKHAQMALRKLSHHMEKKELKQMKQEAMMKGLVFPITGRGMGY